MPVLPSNLTTKFDPGALLRTLNPVSPFFGSGKQYIPQFATKLFSAGKGSSWDKSGTPAKLTHLLAKMGSGAALFGASAWLVRALMHSMKIDNIDSMDASATAGQKLQKLYKRPTEPVLAYKQKDASKLKPVKDQGQDKKASIAEPYGVALGTLPVAMSLAALVAAYKMSDKYYDKKLSQELDSRLARAQSQRDATAKRRILRARGVSPLPQPKEEQGIEKKESMKPAVKTLNPKPEPVSEQEQDQKNKKKYKMSAKDLQKTYNTIGRRVMSRSKPQMAKQASVFSTKTSAILGILGALILTGGFAGGYALQNSMDKDRVRYKARKEGLQAYNKARLSEQNVQTQPLHPQLIRLFNAGLDKGKVAQPAQTNTTKYTDLLI